MVSQFAGIKYKLHSSDRFDDFLKAQGVGFFIRKLITSFTPVVEMIANPDATYTVRSSTAARNVELTFAIGDEFEQETMDGRKVTTLVTQEGDNKLVEVQKGDKPMKIVREFSKDTFTMTMTFGDVVCTRIYKAIQ